MRRGRRGAGDCAGAGEVDTREDEQTIGMVVDGGSGDKSGASDKAASSPGASVDDQVGLVCAHARAACMPALRMGRRGPR